MIVGKAAFYIRGFALPGQQRPSDLTPSLLAGQWFSVECARGARTTKSVCTCQGLRPRRVVGELAIARPFVWPSAYRTASAPGNRPLRGSMAGLHTPLSTLDVRPRDRPRMTRGRCGSLLLHRNGLAPSALCRSPGASDSGHSAVDNRAAQIDPEPCASR
jgi:hypothetical protein